MGVGISGAAAIQGSILGAGLAAASLKKEFSEKPDLSKSKSSGIDMKMAAKARKEAQAKINAIYANKDKTRRLGKVMDEYNKQVGGKK